jgi:hypothetical protein
VEVIRDPLADEMDVLREYDNRRPALGPFLVEVLWKRYMPDIPGNGPPEVLAEVMSSGQTPAKAQIALGQH